MRFTLYAIFALLTLNGCAKKTEELIIGKWTFSSFTAANETEGSVDCILDLKKDNTYVQTCTVDLKNEMMATNSSVQIISSGDWIFQKEEKSGGYFLIKPKEYQYQTTHLQLDGKAFAEHDLQSMTKKESASPDSEIKFKVLSEKNGKLFIQIFRSTEELFPEGSFSMSRYDEKNNKVDSSGKNISKNKSSDTENKKEVSPPEQSAESPKAEGPAEQYAVLLCDNCSDFFTKSVIKEFKTKEHYDLLILKSNKGKKETTNIILDGPSTLERAQAVLKFYLLSDHWKTRFDKDPYGDDDNPGIPHEPKVNFRIVKVKDFQ